MGANILTRTKVVNFTKKGSLWSVTTKNKKGEIINLDLNIICDYPKINPIRDNIRNNLSKILKIKKDSINIKATSTEDEGFVNTKKGIACQTMISLRVFDYA